MARIKRKKLVDEVMGFRWYFQIGGSEDSAFKWYCSLFDLPPPPPHTLDNHAGCFGEHSHIPFTGLIWIRQGEGAGVMAHEIAHAVAHVCRTLELDPREADEFQASYTGYLMRNLNILVRKK